MSLFPLIAIVTILFDGQPISGYSHVFEADGHIFVPVRPYVTRVADHMWYANDRLAIERGGRVVYLRVPRVQTDALDGAFVPLRRIMDALGVDVTYSNENRAVDIRVPFRAIVSSPTPFDASLPQSSPSAVFTPEPGTMPRPQWEGPPLPRRTPLLYTVPTATPKP